MPSPIYRHLFVGEDMYASHREARVWEDLFCKKYGDTTRYILDGSEYDAARQSAFLSGHVGAQNLFGGVTLLVIKRICSKVNPTASEKTHLKKMCEKIEAISAGTTIVWWEPFALPDTHPLIETMKKWQEQSQAKIHLYSLPTTGQVVRFAQTYLQTFQQSLTPEAQTWLRARYQEIHDEQKGWWLHTLLEGVSIRSGELVDEQSLVSAVESITGSGDPFALTDAIALRDFARAYQLAHELDLGSEQSAYFQLFGALAWQVNRKPGRLQSYEVKHVVWLLGQVELIIKNGDLPGRWILLRLIRSIETGENLLDPKKIWLSTLPV